MRLFRRRVQPQQRRPGVLLAAPAGGGAITFVGEGGDASFNDTSAHAIPLPSGTQQDDFLLLTISGRSLAQQPYTVLTGYTEVQPSEGNSGQTLYQLWKIAGASETDPTVQSTVGTNGWSAHVTAWRGVDLTTPLDVAASINEATSLGMTALGVTTVTDNAMVLRSYAHGTATGVVTNIVDAIGTPAVAFNDFIATFVDQAHAQTYIAKTPAGATGDGTADGLAANTWIATTIALRPAAGGAGTQVVTLAALGTATVPAPQINQTAGAIPALGIATTPAPQINQTVAMTTLGTASAAAFVILGPQTAGPLPALGTAVLGTPQIDLRLALGAIGPATSPAPSIVQRVAPAALGTATTPAPTVAPGLLTIGPFAALGPATSPAPQINLRIFIAVLGGATVPAPALARSVVVGILGGATTPAPTINQAVAFPVLGPAQLFDPAVQVAGSGVQPPRLGGATTPSPTIATGAATVGPMAALGSASIPAPALALRLSVPLLGGAALATPTLRRSVVVALLGGASTPAPIIAVGAVSIGPAPTLGGASVPAPTITSGIGTGPGPTIMAGATPRPSISGSRQRPSIRSSTAHKPELV
jgi:hypothetical protein